VRFDFELRDLDNAVEVAHIRVADAQSNLDRVLEHQRQRDIAGELASVVEYAGRAHAELAALVAAIRDMTDVLYETRRLGADPSAAQPQCGRRSMSQPFLCRYFNCYVTCDASNKPCGNGRKTRPSAAKLTVIFSDLVGSTALSARMEPEDLRRSFRPTRSAWQRPCSASGC
jgi:hypothetical protein